MPIPLRKIVADDRIPFLRGALEPYAEVVYRPGAAISPADVADADAVITRTRTRCDARLLDRAAVRLIATATIGFDHLDTAYLDRRGIAWCNAPGCNADSVNQYLVGVLLTLADRRGDTLAGRTLGVVGVGQVGRRVAAAAEILGMRVLRNDPPRAEREGDGAFVPLDEVLRQSDFITLHVPLTAGGPWPTHHLADAAFLARMKPGAVLINAARGAVCDNPALADALRRGALGGAVLDVWENEPRPDAELLAGVELATAHIAGYSTDGKANGTARSVRAVGAFFGIDALRDWYPAEIPPPAQPCLPAPTGGSLRRRLAELVYAAYDPRRDDAALRAAPERFEELRGNYPLRREFPAYTLTGGDPELRRIAGQLGFRLG